MTTTECRAPGDAGERTLDTPARAALFGAHSHLAVWRGRIARYRSDVAPFVTLPPVPGPADWADLAGLVGAGARAMLPGFAAEVPPDWEVLDDGAGVQMTGSDVMAMKYAEAVRLEDSDVPEMLALGGRTRPGPFLPRTIEMGTYLGVRRDGRLIAMAGERVHPPGWTEISAVCTDPEFRGQGLASRLVLAVAAGIRERGETPFLHAAATNVTAIRIYRKLGFRLRRRTRFTTLRAPLPVLAE